MKLIEYLNMVNMFHSLVLRESTGTSGTFAGKLGISQSNLYIMINDLRDMGIDIRYSRERQTFYYAFPNEVECHLIIRHI